ncbi:hypothetical protein, partial [Streptomyces sp. NPDC000188]|uniref:hypothetical protein n=1 Tax=Streptomyces sp. NPDC000188 TaxID=3154245 RepID=UPI003323BBA5
MRCPRPTRVLRSAGPARRPHSSPRGAVADLQHLERLKDSEQSFAVSLYEPVGAAPAERRFKIYRVGEQVSLSAVLPV